MAADIEGLLRKLERRKLERLEKDSEASKILADVFTHEDYTDERQNKDQNEQDDYWQDGPHSIWEGLPYHLPFGNFG